MVEKYSIFINFPQLRALVDQLATEVGNPSFMPHVTLAGHIHASREEAVELTKGVAATARPFELEFNGLGTQNREFRFFCLLARPSADLKNIYSIVHNMIPDVSDETFNTWPHASLLYGTPSAVKMYPRIDPLIERFGQTLDGMYAVSNISLWETSGPVERWNEIVSCQLGSW